MTPNEADTLAKRIINTWRGGPHLNDWREELEPLEHGRAGTAYARLRRTIEHTPTIRQFLSEYRGLDTHDAANTTGCHLCDRSGWVTAPPITLDADSEQPRTYTQVQPCDRCVHGEQARRSTAWTHRTGATAT